MIDSMLLSPTSGIAHHGNDSARPKSLAPVQHCMFQVEGQYHSCKDREKEVIGIKSLNQVSCRTPSPTFRPLSLLQNSSWGIRKLADYKMSSGFDI